MMVRTFLACWAIVLFMLGLTISVASAPKPGKDIAGVIIMFNGKQVDDVVASTKVKEWRPVFEKELGVLSTKLPGKPTLKVTYWYTIINGCAVHWVGGEEGTAKNVKATLEKLPYILSVQFDEAAEL